MAFYEIKFNHINSRKIEIETVSIVQGKIRSGYINSKSVHLCPNCNTRMVENVIMFMSKRLFEQLKEFITEKSEFCYYCRECDLNFIDVE